MKLHDKVGGEEEPANQCGMVSAFRLQGDDGAYNGKADDQPGIPPDLTEHRRYGLVASGVRQEHGGGEADPRV